MVQQFQPILGLTSARGSCKSALIVWTVLALIKGAKLDAQKIGLCFTHQLNGPTFRAKPDPSDLQCIFMRESNVIFQNSKTPQYTTQYARCR